MIEFQEKDIPVLDFIIDELCENSNLFFYITAKYLGDKKKFGFGETNVIGDLIFKERDNEEFERLASIINKSGKAIINRQSFMSPLSISRNNDTLQFKELGGFANEYKKLKKEQEKEAVEYQKSIIDLELAEKMLKEFPKTKWFARIGLIIGVILMLKDLFLLF